MESDQTPGQCLQRSPGCLDHFRMQLLKLDCDPKLCFPLFEENINLGLQGHDSNPRKGQVTPTSRSRSFLQ